MNKHFEDALYYLKRAGEHARIGVEETLEAAEANLRAWTGREKAPEPDRVEALRDDVADLERRVESETRAAIGKARGKLEAYRADR